MKAHVNKYISVSFMLSLLIFLLCEAPVAMAALSSGLQLCGTTIIPALFPYLVLANLLAHGQGLQIPWLHRLFRIEGNATPVLFMGLLGGYPTGTKTIANLYQGKQLSKADAEHLLFFACNAGPAFVLGVVGGAVYHSVSVGVVLYAVQVITSFLCGLLRKKKEENFHCIPLPKGSPEPFAAALTKCIRDAGINMINICAFVVFFSVLIAMEHMLLGNTALFPYLSAFTELSSGTVVIAAANMPWAVKFMLTSASISLGGLCVLMQTMAVLADSGLSIRPYLYGKTLQAMLSALIAWPLSYALAPFATASALDVTFAPISPWPWTIFSVLLVFVIFRKFTTGNSPCAAL